MLYGLIDRLTDRLFDFDLEKDGERALLSGGWIILIGFFILLFDLDNELFWGVVLVWLLGAVFAGFGVYVLMGGDIGGKKR